MKTIGFLIILVLCVCSLSAFAQIETDNLGRLVSENKLTDKAISIVDETTSSNHLSDAQSFLTTNKIWSDYHCTDHYNQYDENGKFLGWTKAEISMWYKIGTDSFIGTKQYKQILFSEDSIMKNWNLKVFMCEEGEKIFQYDPVSKKEILLYNFGMQLGDTLFDANGYVATVLQEVRDTVLDKERKLYSFFKYEYDSYSHKINELSKSEEIWVEGIGAIRGGLLRPLSDFQTSGDINYSGLICYYENGELVYHNPDFNYCYYRNFSNIREINSTLDFQIYPNPTSGKFILKTDNGNSDCTVRVFDMNGKQVRFYRMNDSDYLELDLSNAFSGTYLVKFYKHNFSVTKKIIINIE